MTHKSPPRNTHRTTAPSSGKRRILRPRRSAAQAQLLRLLHRAFLDIRVTAYESGDKRVFGISDLMHTLPLALEGAATPLDYRRIMQELRLRARDKGVEAWIDNALTDDSMARQAS